MRHFKIPPRSPAAILVALAAAMLVPLGCAPLPPDELEVDGLDALGQIDAAITEGQTVPSRTITVSNRGTAVLVVTISDSESSGGNWLAHSPSTLTVPKNQSATFTVSFPGASALFAGTYTGTIRLDGTTQGVGTPSSPPTIFIPVNLTVRRAVAGLSIDTPIIDIDSGAPDVWFDVAAGPEPRHLPTMAWTSFEVLVTGGLDSSGIAVGSSWLYDTLSDSWRRAYALDGDYVHATAVYDDGLVYLFGGIGPSGPSSANNVLTVYEPILDQTLALPTHGLPRYLHASTVTAGRVWVWGGRVWDGTTGVLTNSGFSFDIANGQFFDMSSEDAPTARVGATLVGVPGGLIVWGGVAGSCADDGARYDIALDEWSPLAAAPAGVAGPGVWTGKELVVWGGCGTPGGFGAAYDPARDRWRPLSTLGEPAARFDHSVVWTGAEAIVFGGVTASGWSGDGAIYNPVSDAWTILVGDEPEAPGQRRNHGAVWTGKEMMIWGGFGPGYSLLGTGSFLYD